MTTIININAALIAANVALVIATLLYTMLNYKYVRLIEKERRERMARELMDDVYSPIVAQLTPLSKGIINIYIEGFIFKKLKQQRPSLVYRVPRHIRVRLEEFTNNYDNFLDKWRKLQHVLDEIYRRTLVTTFERLSIPFPLSPINLDIIIRDRLYDQKSFHSIHFILHKEEIDELLENATYIELRSPSFSISNVSSETLKRLINSVESELVIKDVYQDSYKLYRRLIEDTKQILRDIGKEIENSQNI